MRFYASSGDEARLTALLEHGIVNILATDKVILSGHTGLRANLMGEYKMEEERVNEYPLYKKAKEDHYIYRNTDGKWWVTNSRADVDKGIGHIYTQGPAQLPTSEGVTWKYWDGKGVPDDAISAIDVKVSIRYDT